MKFQKLNWIELKEFLDQKVLEYNQPQFIETDPIQIPHRFQTKEDIEISGFFAAMFAWGNRKIIINKTVWVFTKCGGFLNFG